MEKDQERFNGGVWVDCPKAAGERHDYQVT